jgi:hypothetical protein
MAGVEFLETADRGDSMARISARHRTWPDFRVSRVQSDESLIDSTRDHHGMHA